MIKSFLITSLGLVAVVLVSAGCDGGPRAPSFTTDCTRLVTGAAVAEADTVEVDVYLDATTSMEGYVGRSTEYGTFLYDLEGTLNARWRDADVQFFRFGTYVDSIGRAEYLQAREDLSFYRVRGLYARTNIDSVLARADPGRLSVVVTDLFEDDGDTNALVEQIKNRVFARGLAVGVLGIESQFDGRVYDAPGGPYRYVSSPNDPSTYRPFYALLIGPSSYLRRLVRTLEGGETVNPDHFVLISPHVVRDYELAFEKPRESGGINVQAENRFRLLGNGEPTTLRGRLTYDPIPAAVPVDPAGIELRAYRRSPGQQDSTLTSDLRLEGPTPENGAVTFDLDVRPEGEAGTYQYLLLFEAGSEAGGNTPEWVEAFSTTNPTQASDPNKTLNLARLVSGLVDASSTVRRPVVGCATITVTKP